MPEKKEEEEKVAEGTPPEAGAGEKAGEDVGGEGSVQGGEADREEDPKGSGDPDVLFGAPEEEPEEELEEEPEEEPADLESEVADLKDKLLRALAEMENVRRRAQRNSADASRYAIANFAREMLGVADNLRRALDSAAGPGEEDGEAPRQADADAGEDEAEDKGDRLEQLITGVEMTEREMLNAFERAGIKPIEAMGHRFDHNYHEAMFEVEDESQPTGTVIQVMQPGFMINDRLLRPAKVGVSKGGPKAEPDTDPDDKPDPAATGKAAAYEKQVDTSDETTGTQLDREL